MSKMTSSVSVALRTYFSVLHIQSAALFARHVAEIEATFDGKFTDVLYATHSAYVTASIFASVSFLEATINEFLSDAGDIYGSKLLQEGLDKKTIELMADMWSLSVPRTARYGLLEKYKIALALARKETFEPSRQPYKDVDLLVKLRNNLIHYEPEWRHGDLDPEFDPKEEKEKMKFVRALRLKKFPLNPLFGAGNPFYPDRCLSYGCAKWAVESSIQFTDEFFDKLGVRPFYDHVRGQLSCSR